MPDVNTHGGQQEDVTREAVPKVLPDRQPHRDGAGERIDADRTRRHHDAELDGESSKVEVPGQGSQADVPGERTETNIAGERTQGEVANESGDAALDAYSRTVVGVADALAPSVANLQVTRRGRAVGAGSGFVIAPDGFLVTSAHVIA